MASNEVSKLVWVGIVVALAGGLYGAAKPQVDTIATDTFSKVHQFVNNSQGFNLEPSVPKPDENDPKWVEKSNYGENGRFLRDKDGNAIVYAIDKSKPIILKDITPEQTREYGLVTIDYQDKVVIIGAASNGMFRWNRDLTTITGLNKFDTSQATDMSQMFAANERLKNLDVSNFDTSNVTDMSEMFYQVTSIETLDVSHFNTGNVNNMESMFSNLDNVTELNVSHFNTSKVTNMKKMFALMDNLKHIDISNFDTSNTTTMRMMFLVRNDTDGNILSKYRLSTGKADVSKFKVENITDSYMFNDIHELPNLIDYLETFSYANDDVA